jgi:uncharacterized membrane protein
MDSATARAVLCSVALVWLGLVVGVSFIATPAKFLAPTLNLAVALDVGRHTFAVFAVVEAVAAALLVGITLPLWRQPRISLASALVAFAVLLQQFWLLPLLDARVATILAGGSPTRSSLHGVYIASEALKVLALGWIAVAGRLRA